MSREDLYIGYGKTMESVQKFEASLFCGLAVFRLVDKCIEEKRGFRSETFIDEVLAVMEEINATTRTMGRMFYELFPETERTKEFHKMLTDTKDVRNDLAHNFFMKKNLWSHCGQAEAVSDLAKNQDAFTRLAHSTTNILKKRILLKHLPEPVVDELFRRLDIG